MPQTFPPLATVILAAGQGKRMQDPTKPKVLYEIAGIPMIGHVLKLASQIGSQRTIAIVGFGKEQVNQYVSSAYPQTEFAIQSEQLGTGHAMQMTSGLLSNFEGDILVLYGDVPLLSESTVQTLLNTHRASGAKATVLSAIFEDPSGYGRIVRSDDGKHLKAIIEDRDADPEVKKIKEMNSGIYVFQAASLYPALAKITPNNNQKEYYLTDVFGILIGEFGTDSVAISVSRNPVEVSGVNTKDQLQELERIYLKNSSIRA
ncbi:MAG: NTP transferase domain-containing protein [Bacteroidota bacterium]|nr:NTP transferase domain-containing protein [Bacteroidota bacterium]